ncbi:MAG TPA: hypothetical protein P5523_08825, partial [Bacteroidales bacterium]|nr:hypothetical protein [Bacteroidales bacterium]
MKKTIRKTGILFIAAVFLLCASIFTATAQNQSQDTLKEIIASMPGVSGVERLKTDQFKDKYLLFVEQPIDHKNPDLGSFKQRVFVMNAGLDKP